MLFTPPFVEGWRSKLRLQNRKACVVCCTASLRNIWNIIPNSSSRGRPQKESPVENHRPRSKVCVSHSTQDFTRRPPVCSLPPKGNGQTSSNTQVGTADPYPSLLPGYFDLVWVVEDILYRTLTLLQPVVQNNLTQHSNQNTLALKKDIYNHALNN